MKLAHSITMLAAALYVFGESPIAAEFRCESKVSYVVELAPKTAPVKSEVASDLPAKKDVTPAPAAETKESTVAYSTVEAKGEDEAKAKIAVQKVSVRLLEKAREECRMRHENVAACIAAKYDATATTMQTLSFSARKSLEDAVRSDCEAQRGICKKVETSDPVCAEIVVAATTTASPEAESGKEEKKKGKK